MAKRPQLPLKWTGGKHYMAAKIVERMPRHLHYVEPYFGGGAVLFARDPLDESLFWGTGAGERGVSEVVGDVHGELTNFWRVLQDEQSFAEMRRKLEATPFSQAEFREACNSDARGTVNRACEFFVRCRQSRAGGMKDFTPITRNRTRRQMNEQASAWIAAIDGLEAIHQRLRGVVVLTDTAERIIKKHDGPKTFFYLDPPYLHEKRSTNDLYEHEMSREDHESMLQQLAGIQGKFMLSGYRSELYDDWAEKHDYSCEMFELPNNVAGGSKKRRMVECLWTNYDQEEK